MSILKLYPLFMLSGAAALIYQVVWVRLLSLSISSTSASISIVVATFFMGMALGNELTTRLQYLQSNYFRLFILAEVLIVVSALILLPALLHLDQLVLALPFIGQYVMTKIILVCILLIVPTGCIGASFPLLVNAMVANGLNVDKKLGLFYAVNTLGAVFGAIGAGFVFIPNLDLDGAIYVALIFNVLVVVIAMFNRHTFFGGNNSTSLRSKSQREGKSSVAITLTIEQKKLLLILFMTGFVSLSCEVAWVKYLSIYTHTTLYGFSAILGIFLSGLAVGAFLLDRYIYKIKDTMTFLVYLLVSLTLALIFTRFALAAMPSIVSELTSSHYAVSSNAIKYIFIVSFIAVPTLLFGASFALCLDLICGGSNNKSVLIGRVYSINTVGAVLGVLLTGLWIIPSWGSDVALIIGVSIMCICPFIIIKKSKLLILGLSVGTVFFIAVNLLTPRLDFKNMISVSLYYFDKTVDKKQATYKFIKEGRNGVVSVSTYDGKYHYLKKNSLSEAVILNEDVFTWRAETLLVLLPYFFAENPKSAFIVGLGAGTTLSAATLTKLQQIDVVEMDPVVEEASHYLFPGGIKALHDPRVNFSIDDARHRLLLRKERYDLIISQPSHPWLSGSAHLFTQEYFEIVKSRLSENGVFSQWVNLFNMDATTLKSIFKALHNVFPYGINFIVMQESGLLLIASNEPIYFNYSKINAKIQEPLIANVLAKWNIRTANDLLTYFSLSYKEAKQLSIDSTPNTDMNILSEIRLANLRQFSTGDEDPVKSINKMFTFDIADYLSTEKRRESLQGIQLYFMRNNDRFRQFRVEMAIRKLGNTSMVQ